MKTLIIAACLISSIAFAQSQRQRMPLSSGMSQQGPSQAGEILPENYQLKLIISEKEQQTSELSIVSATDLFKASTCDPIISFAGQIVPQDDGTILVRYSLGTQIRLTQTGTNNIEFRDGSFESSVRLRVGEPIQILKTGTQTYQLVISRLSEGPKKGK